MTGPDLALHLAANVHLIAKHEAAGLCYRDITQAVTNIERLINRPIPPQFLGRCPIVLTNNYGDKVCDTDLQAARDERYVQCSSCHTTHDIRELLDKQLEYAEQLSFTLSELYKTILPINREYVPLSTLRHWIARGRLVPTGHDADGEPRYLLANVRELRDAKPQKASTGGAAHKKPA